MTRTSKDLPTIRTAPHSAAFVIVVSLMAMPLAAQETQLSANRQSLDDAWWTGPIVTAGAGTLPKGHSLVEPYLFDVIRYGRYDTDGNRQSAERTHSYGSLTYILCGITDRVTVGLIPTFGYNDVNVGRDSSGVQLGDLTLQGQLRLSQFREGGRVPTMSIVLQQSLPTGKYDRLGDKPNDALGSGAYTTTLSLYTQYYWWMPNGRILRTRFNLSQAFSDDATVNDVSVYGTASGFRGRASPGDSFMINASGEYSITRHWVLALDLIYQHDDSTRLRGAEPDATSGALLPVDENFGSSRRFGVAPAIEYNWSSQIGVIAGARWFAAGRNTGATVTPAVALNMVF